MWYFSNPILFLSLYLTLNYASSVVHLEYLQELHLKTNSFLNNISLNEMQVEIQLVTSVCTAVMTNKGEIINLI